MTLDLLSYLTKVLVFHENRVISPVSNPEGTASLDAQAGENLVKRMFARAWEDGKITKDEQQLITEVEPSLACIQKELEDYPMRQDEHKTHLHQKTYTVTCLDKL